MDAICTKEHYHLAHCVSTFDSECFQTIGAALDDPISGETPTRHSLSGSSPKRLRYLRYRTRTLWFLKATLEPRNTLELFAQDCTGTGGFWKMSTYLACV